MKNNKKSSIIPLLASIIRHNVLVSAALAVVIAAAIIVGVLPPLVLERIVNTLVQNNSVRFGEILIYFGFLALTGALDSGKEVCITIFGQKVTHGLRSEMAKKLERLPASYFTAQESGMTVSRFVNDVNAVDTLFSSGVISMIIDAGKIISILFVIFTRSVGLGVIILVLIPPLYVLTRVFQKRILTAQIDNRVAVGEANNRIPETIKNIRVIRLMHAQKYMTKRYEDSIEKSFHAQETSILYDALYSPIVITVSTTIIAVMMVSSAQSGAVRSFFGISVGTAVALIQYVGKIFDPLENIGMEIQNIQSAIAGVHRVMDFLDETEMNTVEVTEEKEDAPAVEMNAVQFAYDPSERYILQNVNILVNRGEQVTLTGRTGAGKSTIFKILMGLYEPQGGEVLVYGRQPNQIPDKEKRSVYGYVEQQFRAVAGTIADQISLHDPKVSEEEIKKSLQFVGLWDSVERMENGMNTIYSEQQFSQGQIQLLSIARAIVKNPKLMLLDEITANLDAATEHQVLTTLENAAKNRTVLSISHRLYEKSISKRIVIGS